MKRIKSFYFIIITVICMIIAVGYVYAIDSNNSGVTINAKEVDLYYLEQNAQNLGVQIPEEYKTSFQIEVTGTNIIPEYNLDSNIYLRLNNGIVTPTQNGTGQSIVHIIVGNEEYELKVNIHNYLDVYIENMYKEYISKNITDQMSDYEKMQKICDFVVQYGYDLVPDYRYLPLKKGGDCIASSQTIIKMSEMLGIKAYERYAAFEPGAGDNHRNVTAVLDGKVYIVEAGFNEEAPRHYTIEEESGGFTFGWETNTNNPLLIQYDGFDENVIVPEKFTREKVEGFVDYPLKVIGELSFERAARTPGAPTIKTIKLPSTVEKIGESAFSDCKDLTSINIPESLSEIGKFAFSECYSLTNFDVDPKNPNYTFENGILYNKNKTKVILCAPGKTGEIILDENVRTIGEYAFYKCKGITNIVLGNKVETIEPHAFEYCNMYGINIPKSVTVIDNNAFSNCYVRYVKIEEGCKAPIKDSGFFACGNLSGIVIPSSVPSIGTDAFRGSNNTMFYVEKNSPASNWLDSNNKSNRMQIIDAGSNQILPGMIIFNQSVFDYDGTEKTPEIVVQDGSKTLQQNVDYTVTYKNNINASSNYNPPCVVVTGIGKYSGTAEKSFTISKISSDFTIKLQDSVYGEDIKLELVGNNAGYNEYDKKILYNTVQSRDNASKDKPTDVGTYYVYVAVTPKNTNYGTRAIWGKFNILQAENELKISCSDVSYGNSPNVKVITNKSGGALSYYYKLQNEPDSNYTTNVPTELGAYSVKVISEETKNYKQGVAIANFEIKEKVTLKGDLNKDGIVDPIDASIALDKYKYSDATEEDLEIGDMDENGIIDPIDASMILDVYKGA